VVVFAGDALTTASVVEFNPPDGNHEYELAPDAVSVTGEAPLQSVDVAGLTVIVGYGETSTEIIFDVSVAFV